MTSDKLEEFMRSQLNMILEKHELKSKSYGNHHDAFFNFRETARRQAGREPTQEEMFKVLLTLADKHWVALMQGGAHTPEAYDRLLDMMVYCLIGRAMLAEMSEDMAKELTG